MPDELIIALANALEGASTNNWNQLRSQALDAVWQPAVHNQVQEFLNFWHSHAPSLTTESVSLALLTAAQVEEHYRNYEQIELVWTGPDSKIIPLRRTDQALLQLIDEAQQSLHIVSFAVYKADTIVNAIVRAMRRGVATAIYLETPNASEGKIAFDTISALGEDVAKSANIYTWPLEKRPLSTEGKYGSLHAKVAIADRRVMLISSANLTEYAMTLNMEMGILVRGGPLPAQVESHLRKLVEREVFALAL
jgi:phosphatidylserine/phosphatidylglycerophosphate/cardiolipin synthase-like enzyme